MLPDINIFKTYPIITNLKTSIMKTTKKQKGTILTLILFASLCVNSLHAQMSGFTYSIINMRTCDVAVHYEVSDCGTPGQIVCNSTYQKINANGGVFSIPSGCPNPTYDIFVWLLEIDYVDVTGGNNNGSVSGACLWSGQGLSATGSNAPSSCPPSTWIMSWSATNVTIN